MTINFVTFLGGVKPTSLCLLIPLNIFHPHSWEIYYQLKIYIKIYKLIYENGNKQRENYMQNKNQFKIYILLTKFKLVGNYLDRPISINPFLFP